MATLLDVLRYRKADAQERNQVLEGLLKDSHVQGVLGGVVRKYLWTGEEEGNLRNRAREGFWEALKGYDPWKGFKNRRLCFRGQVDSNVIQELNQSKVPRHWFNDFALSGKARVEVKKGGLEWEVWDEDVVYIVVVLGTEMRVYEGASFWTYVRWKARERIREEIRNRRNNVDPDEALPWWLRNGTWPAGYEDAGDRRDLLKEALKGIFWECWYRHVLPKLRVRDPNFYFLWRQGEFKSSREMFKSLYPNFSEDFICRMDAAFRQWQTRTFRPYRDGHWLWRRLDPQVQDALRQDFQAFPGKRRISWGALSEWAQRQEVLRGLGVEAVAGAMAHGLNRAEKCSICVLEEVLSQCGCGFTLKSLEELFL